MRQAFPYKSITAKDEWGMDLEELTKHLTTLVQSTLETHDWYQWRMPKTLPVGVSTVTGTGFEQTRALKQAISGLYSTDESRRVDLATYFVRVWGGVRGNRPETLESYVFKEAEELIAIRKFKGISSWSKVLHLREPDNYFIYDARIAVVLNLVQRNHSVTDPVLFHMPDSQNRLIKPVRKLLAEKAKAEGWKPAPSDMYCQYNKLIFDVGRRVGEHGDLVEMALFSKAPALAEKFLPKGESRAAQAKAPSGIKGVEKSLR